MPTRPSEITTIVFPEPGTPGLPRVLRRFFSNGVAEAETNRDIFSVSTPTALQEIATEWRRTLFMKLAPGVTGPEVEKGEIEISRSRGQLTYRRQSNDPAVYTTVLPMEERKKIVTLRLADTDKFSSAAHRPEVTELKAEKHDALVGELYRCRADVAELVAALLLESPREYHAKLKEGLLHLSGHGLRLQVASPSSSQSRTARIMPA